ncbi:MAG: hypothetical protein ABFD24_09150 [Anaerolineaceae bacterium]
MPLPEIILAKMLIPGSFRFTRSGFTFNLQNNFAPGTITSLKLISGNEEIPPSKIWFQIEGQARQSAAEISPEHPAAFPTGLLITTTAEHPGPLSNLVLLAETREAGTIQLTVRKPSNSVQKEPSWIVNLKRPLMLAIPALSPGIELDPALLGVSCSSLQSLQKGDQSITPPLLVMPAQPGAEGDRWGKAIPSLEIGLKTTNDWSALSGSASRAGNLTGPQERTKVLRLIRTDCLSGMDPFMDQSDPITRWIIGGNAWQPWELSPESAHIYAGKVDLAWNSLSSDEVLRHYGVMGKPLLTDDVNNAYAKWNQTLLQDLHSPIDEIYWQVPPLAEWIRPEEIPSSGWRMAFECLTGMIDRMEKLLDSFDNAQSVKQGVDFSKMISSLASEIRNRQTDLDTMDLVFLLLTLFSACASRSKSLDFATLFNLSDTDLHNSPLQAAYNLISHHFRGSQAGSLTNVIFAGTAWSSEHSGFAFVTTSDHGNRIDISAVNPQYHHRLRVTLPEDLIIGHPKILISRSQLRNGLQTFKTESRSSGTIQLDLHPRSLALFELSRNTD